VDEETRRNEELEKTKEAKQREWLDKVIAEQSSSKAHQSQTGQPSEDVVDDTSSQKSKLELEDILLDEEKVTAAMKTIANQEITERMESATEAVSKKEYTDYDELD
jgi:hypothetical protein